MNPSEIKALRERLDLSQREFGEAVGLSSDQARVVRAWEEGTRKGSPFQPTGTAMAAMRYLAAISDALEAPTFQDARQRLLDTLPPCLAEKV